MESEIIKLHIENFIKAVTFYQLAITPEETFEYSIRKINYFGDKKGVDEYMSSMPEQHISRRFYNKLDKLNNNEFMKIKTIAFMKMIIWEIENKINDWHFIKEDEDVEQMATKVAETDISNIEEFVKSNKKLLDDNINKYKYYFALLYECVIGQKEEQITNMLKTELNLFQEYNFHSIYKSDEDEFFYQNAEDERNQYINLIRAKMDMKK